MKCLGAVIVDRNPRFWGWYLLDNAKKFLSLVSRHVTILTHAKKKTWLAKSGYCPTDRTCEFYSRPDLCLRQQGLFASLDQSEPVVCLYRCMVGKE